MNFKPMPPGLSRAQTEDWLVAENPAQCGNCFGVYEQETLDEHAGYCEGCWDSAKESIIFSLQDHIEAVEDERDVYLAFFELVGIDPAKATRIGRQYLSVK